jgi:hypothetical protein
MMRLPSSKVVANSSAFQGIAKKSAVGSYVFDYRTVSVASLLVTLPALLLTTTEKRLPLSS